MSKSRSTQGKSEVQETKTTVALPEDLQVRYDELALAARKAGRKDFPTKKDLLAAGFRDQLDKLQAELKIK